MAADFQVRSTQISGITGSNPICTKLELWTRGTNGYTACVFTSTISNNDPNILTGQRYDKNTGDEWRIILKDASDTIIAQSEWSNVWGSL